jgi:GT2 family glycosyltransferase
MVTFDSAEALRRTLPVLRAELRPDDELVVVDNASGDETLAVVGELAPRAMVVAGESNVGFAAACNVGAARASSELVCFRNPDAVP